MNDEGGIEILLFGCALLLLLAMAPNIVALIILYYVLKAIFPLKPKTEPKPYVVEPMKPLYFDLTSHTETVEIVKESPDFKDAVSALRNMKYSKAEAEEAVRQAQEEGAVSIEELLQRSFQILANR